MDRRTTLAEELDNEATTADEKAPFLQSTEDRVQQKIQQYKLKLPEELEKFQRLNTAEGNDQLEEEKNLQEDAKIHYDKEDLISFH